MELVGYYVRGEDELPNEYTILIKFEDSESEDSTDPKLAVVSERFIILHSWMDTSNRRCLLLYKALTNSWQKSRQWYLMQWPLSP